MIKVLLKSLALSLIIALMLRAILLTIQYEFFFEVDFKFWSTLFDHSCFGVLKNIEWSNSATLSKIIFAPIFEGLQFALVIFLALKVKFPKLLIVAMITVIAYFLHAPIGNEFYPIQASVSFAVYTLFYFHLMSLSTKPHIHAYSFTTIAHALYNFVGVYLVALYKLDGVF